MMSSFSKELSENAVKFLWCRNCAILIFPLNLIKCEFFTFFAWILYLLRLANGIFSLGYFSCIFRYPCILVKAL